MEELSRKSFDPNQNEFWQGYHFDYDAWGNTEEIKVWKPTSGTAATPTGDTTTLATYQYNVNGTLARMNYPSGQYVTYEYDLLDRLVKEVYYNSDDSIQVEYQYIYSSDGQLAKQQAIRNGTVVESYRFEYDSLGRLIRSREGGDNNPVQRTEHLYDGANRLTAQNWTVGERSFTEAYAYDAADGTMAAMLATYDDGSGWVARDKLTYTYDGLKRLTQVLDTENYSTQFYTRNYTYQDLSGDRTTSRLAQYVYRKPSDSSIIYGNSYAYDANGNITQVNEVYTVNGADASRTLAVYTYDDLNQLTQETRYTYAGTSTTPAATTTVNYTIDSAGNLRSVTGGEHSVSYTYADTAWSDKLTGITVDGVTRTISYADAANPFNWFNGTDYTNLTWTQGRRLSNVTKGSQTYSYEYDMSGVRSVKVANGLRHEYVTQNGRVVRDKVTNDSTGAFQYMLDFVYDESGYPFLMRRYYNEAQTNYNTYHYVLNAQGDVIKLLYGSNTTVAEYSYDAWGNILSATGSLANVNPLRYRGYYYDTETGFYYLQSRYYDPALGRFINADSYASTGQGFLGHNMFAYCGNSPVFCSDHSGTKIEIECDRTSGFLGFCYQVLYKFIILGTLSALTDDTLSLDGNSVIVKETCRNPEHPVSTNLVREIINSNKTAYISTFPVEIYGGSFTEGTDEYAPGSPCDCKVRFDRTQSSSLNKQVGANDYPGFIIMAHELIHAYHIMGGTFDGVNREDQAIGLGIYRSAYYTENAIRAEWGLHFRPTHDIVRLS